MNTATKLQTELEKVLSGEPWYGEPVYKVLSRVTFESAYEKPVNSVHNIAQIILHMISWTEEVIDRMNEKPAGYPLSGNWNDPGAPDEEKWQMYIDDLKLVNVSLVKAIQDFPEQKWDEPIIDERGEEPIVTYAELVRGLIQHHVYHQGQIALLVRIVG